jgi:hypothetical protein
MAFILGTNPLWRIVNNLNQFAIDGRIYTYKDDDRDVHKLVYADANGTIEYPQPIPTNQRGEPSGLLFFEDDEAYWIEIYDGENFLTSFTLNYNTGGGGGGNTNVNTFNLILNPQFDEVDQLLFSPAPSEETIIAPGNWYYKRSNTSGTTLLEFIDFNLGDDDPEQTPLRYLQYRCTSPGTGETENDTYWRFKKVRLFQNTQMTFTIEAQRIAGGGNLILVVEQFFGAGGSPTILTSFPLSTFVSSNWETLSVTFTIPDIGGNSIGINDDDYIGFRVRYPFDTAATINITNAFLIVGNIQYPFIRRTTEIEKVLLLGGDSDGGGTSRNVLVGADFGLNPWQLGTLISIPASVPLVGHYTADKFVYMHQGDGTVGVTQQADAPPAAFASYSTEVSYLVQCNGVQSDSGTNVSFIEQRIEGNLLRQILGGSFNLFLCVKFTRASGTLPATFCVHFRDSTRGVVFSAPLTITSNKIGQWTFFKINIPPPTIGLFPYSANVGMYFGVVLQSNLSAVPVNNQWVASSGIASSTQNNLLDAVGNTFQMALLQIERGSSFYAFYAQTPAEVLMECYREYIGALRGIIGTGVSIPIPGGPANLFAMQEVSYPSEMRVAPTLTHISNYSMIQSYNSGGTPSIYTVTSLSSNAADQVTRLGHRQSVLVTPPASAIPYAPVSFNDIGIAMDARL